MIQHCLSIIAQIVLKAFGPATRSATKPSPTPPRPVAPRKRQGRGTWWVAVTAILVFGPMSVPPSSEALAQEPCDATCVAPPDCIYLETLVIVGKRVIIVIDIFLCEE